MIIGAYKWTLQSPTFAECCVLFLFESRRLSTDSCVQSLMLSSQIFLGLHFLLLSSLYYWYGYVYTPFLYSLQGHYLNYSKYKFIFVSIILLIFDAYLVVVHFLNSLVDQLVDYKWHVFCPFTSQSYSNTWWHMLPKSPLIDLDLAHNLNPQMYWIVCCVLDRQFIRAAVMPASCRQFCLSANWLLFHSVVVVTEIIVNIYVFVQCLLILRPPLPPTQISTFKCWLFSGVFIQYI